MTKADTKIDERVVKYLANVTASADDFLSNVDHIAKKQKQALARSIELGFPSKHLEDWKYYDFNQLLDSKFSFYKQAEKLNEAEIRSYKELVSHHVYPETVNSLLVTINGSFSPELSSLSDFGDDCFNIVNFNDKESLIANPRANELVKNHFASEIDSENNFFKLMNTIFLQRGFLLDIKKNCCSTKTLQILHISSQNTFNQMSSLIVAGKSSELEIMVDYIGAEAASYFTNATINIVLEENAKLKLDKIQNESTEAIQMYNLNAKLNRDSRFEFNSYTFGASSSRDDLNIDIDGSGAEAIANGLYVVTDKRKSHNKISINHNVANANSDQLFKGLLYDDARAEFNGIVVVKEDAQNTNAEQLNKNLLLSDNAHVDSRPQLDIYADDVKCSHGSTIGQLEEEQLFYLQSRGLNREEATTTLTYSFCGELINNIKLESARDMLTKLALRNLSKGLISLTDESAKKQCLN